ncbi:hypothetical protein ACJ2A9_12045 [Anaerobacillus sp. MEB173]|uniref:hypothetical protein n=1 Tax=Anaerobacillus sp. MEB173 TaxID=3383345 RepID=UPI003F93DCDF
MPFSYEAEFNNVYIELSRNGLQQFLKQMIDKDVSLFWRYDEEKIFLMIDSNQNVYEIPFSKKGKTLTINLDHLIVNDEAIGEAIEIIISQFSGNGIVKKFTGGPLYITSYKTGTIQSIIEIDGSEKIMMNQNGAIVEYTDYDHNLEPKTIYNIMNMEIDYELMELYEALTNSDKQKVTKHKKRLQKLIRRRRQVEQLL